MTMATAVHEMTSEDISAVPAPDAVVVRFAGDSGDGMQLTGGQFTLSTALAGNDLATFPDFPEEIRAPQGTLFGRSEEHTSELQSLMRISYAVFWLKKKQHLTSKHTKS